MNVSKSMVFNLDWKQKLYCLILLVPIVVYCAYIIVMRIFPYNLAFIFWPTMLLIAILNIHIAVVLWYVCSVLGNIFKIDLAGFPSLHVSQLFLLVMISGWFITSFREIPQVARNFFRTRKNQTLLILLGWIVFSVMMGRLTGVTQKGLTYQINGLSFVVLAILTSFFISSIRIGDRYLGVIVWVIVSLQTILFLRIIVVGIMLDTGYYGWQELMQEGVVTYGFVMFSPLFLALIFLPQQKIHGKVWFAISVVVAFVFSAFLIISGHRSSFLWLLSGIGGILLFLKARLFLILCVILVIPFFIFNFMFIKTILEEHTAYNLGSEGTIIGEGARIALAKDAMEIISRYPLWGTGMDVYRIHSNLRMLYFGRRIEMAPSAHNSWLQIGVDSGIPALILLVLFCVYLWRDGMRLFRSVGKGLLKTYVLFFLVFFFIKLMESFIGSGQIVPVYTSSHSGDSSALAGSLLSFWFMYGLFLSIENQQLQEGANTKTITG